MMLKICYKAIVLSAFNLQRRLYAVFSNPLRMIHQIGEPVHVVHQVNQPNLGLRSFKPDAPDPSANQKTDPSKNVFNPRSNRRFLFVHRLLKGSQGMVSVPLSMDMILNATLLTNDPESLATNKRYPPIWPAGYCRDQAGQKSPDCHEHGPTLPHTGVSAYV